MPLEQRPRLDAVTNLRNPVHEDFFAAAGFVASDCIRRAAGGPHVHGRLVR